MTLEVIPSLEPTVEETSTVAPTQVIVEEPTIEATATLEEVAVESKLLSTLPTAAELGEGWHQLHPEGETVCSDGSPYSFFVRPADPEKVLLYFQPGGGCWSESMCGFGFNYDGSVGRGDNPANNARGIFDLDNDDNPFADYSMVFAAYCTADTHLGNQVHTYGSGNSAFDIHHKGFTNGMSVLDWMFANYDAPETVFVTGSSAGGIASPFYTTFVAAQYPDARIVQLGDGGGAFRLGKPFVAYPMWGSYLVLEQTPGVNERPELMQAFSFEELYMAGSQLYPNVTFSQFNTAFDGVQDSFLNLLGVDTRIEENSMDKLIQASYADIESADSDNFFGYMGGGSAHVTLPTNDFYTFSADDVPLYQWVSDLANGHIVTSVRCDDCRRPERIEK